MDDFIPKKRMSREQTKAQTREALLSAARIVFTKHGFYSTSLDMVAEAAGYTKGAVYANFRNKEDLYLALLDKHLQQDQTSFNDYIEAGLSADMSDKEIAGEFNNMIEQTHEWATLTMEFCAHAMRDKAIRDKLAERFYSAQQDFKISLEKRIEKGYKLPVPVDQAAAALLAFTNGIDILAMIAPQPHLGDTFTSTIRLLLGEPSTKPIE